VCVCVCGGGKGDMRLVVWEHASLSQPLNVIAGPGTRCGHSGVQLYKYCLIMARMPAATPRYAARCLTYAVRRSGSEAACLLNQQVGRARVAE
jgi:hypothetical protein